jgi:hypothetical protein
LVWACFLIQLKKTPYRPFPPSSHLPVTTADRQGGILFLSIRVKTPG